MALAEDLGDAGDLTSRSFHDADHRSLGRIISRQEAILSGQEIAEAVFLEVDPDLVIRSPQAGGDPVCAGQAVLTVEGKTRSILAAERTALNFLQRLSGVATVTQAFVRAAANPAVAILDTRKTTPGWRELEKQAVVHGGGRNHRTGLFDAVMVKDNHLAALASPRDFAARLGALRQTHPEVEVVVEADNLEQVETFLTLTGIDRILLDNMEPERLREAVGLRDRLRPEVQLEASGGVRLDTIGDIAASGVDCISIGALTHSVPAVDFGLDLSVAT